MNSFGPMESKPFHFSPEVSKWILRMIEITTNDTLNNENHIFTDQFVHKIALSKRVTRLVLWGCSIQMPFAGCNTGTLIFLLHATQYKIQPQLQLSHFYTNPQMEFKIILFFVSSGSFFRWSRSQKQLLVWTRYRTKCSYRCDVVPRGAE